MWQPRVKPTNQPRSDMRRKLSMSEKIRRMIDQGHANKAIIEKLGVKPQVVYNMRYQINKARGLGAISKTAPTPTEGIGAPPEKRNYTRRTTAGTGINHPAFDAGTPEPAAAITATTPEDLEGRPTMVKRKPTLWQRIKERFRG